MRKTVYRAVLVICGMLAMGVSQATETGFGSWCEELVRQKGMTPAAGARVLPPERKAVWSAFRERFGGWRVQMGRMTCVATNAAGRGVWQEFVRDDGVKGAAGLLLRGETCRVVRLSLEGFPSRDPAAADNADEFVRSNLIGTNGVNSAVWGSRTVLGRDAVVSLALSGDRVECPYERSYVYFIDDLPWANWRHAARLVFVDETLTSCFALYVNEPVSVVVAGQDALEAKAVRAERHQGIHGMSLNSAVFSNGSGSDYVALTDGKPGNCYALIVSGGADQRNNHVRYWNDMAFAYNVLSRRYALPKKNIKVLWASGDPDADICWNGAKPCYNDCKSAASGFVASNLKDLDGDGAGDIDGAASRQNLQNAFSWYRQNLKSSDQLFVFVTDHGGLYGDADDPAEPATLCLWGSSAEVKDVELAEMTAEIACPVIFAMETCYSGGFCRDIVDSAPNRLVLTADRFNPSCVFPDHLYIDSWVYYFFSALNGRFPYSQHNSSVLPNVRMTGGVCDADLNHDGRVSFEEAHAYAVKQNPWTAAAGQRGDSIDEPQCQPSGLASRLFLTQYADVGPVALDRVSAPTLSPMSGAGLFAPYVVTASCGTPGATIRYTLDGSDPDERSTCYRDGIAVTRDCTVSVRAFKSGMDKSAVTRVAYQVRKTAPEKAVIMSVSQADSSTAIVIEWLAGAGTGSFDVLRSESQTMSSPVAVASRLSAGESLYADATALRGKTYYYQVRSVNAYGSTLSDVSFGAGLALNPPADVKATVTAVKAKTATVEVSWKAAECASCYKVFRCGKDGRTVAVSGWITGTRYVDETVPLTGASSTFAYYVESAVSGSGSGASPMSEAARVEVAPSTDGWSLLLTDVWWSTSECGDRAIRPGSTDDLCVRLRYADGSLAKCSDCTHVTWAVVEGSGIALTPEDGDARMERPPEVRIAVSKDAREQIATLRATFAPAAGNPITRDVLLYISENGILQSLGISSYSYLVPGESMQLTASGKCYGSGSSKALDEGQAVTWSIISGSGAIIDEYGVLTALSSVTKDCSVVVQVRTETSRGVVSGTRVIDIKCIEIAKQTVEIEPLGGEETRYIPREGDGKSSLFKSVYYRFSPSDWLSGVGFCSGSSPRDPDGGISIQLGGGGSGSINISGYMFITFKAARNPGKDREMLFKLRWSDGGTDYTIRQKEAPYAANPSIRVTSNGLSASAQSDGSVVRYATDGEEPSEKSPVLNSTVNFSRSTPVAAKAFGAWMQDSETVYGDVEGDERPATVKITFDPVEAGVKAPAARTYRVTDVFGELPVLEKKGLFFRGWSLYSDSSKRLRASDYVPSQDAVVYAQWSNIPEDEPEWTALPWSFKSAATGFVKVYDRATGAWMPSAVVGVEDGDGVCRGSSKNGFGNWQDERNGVGGLCVFGIYGNVETGAESGLKFRVWMPGRGFAVVVNDVVDYVADSTLGTEGNPYVLNILSSVTTTLVTFDANGGAGGDSQVTATRGLPLPSLAQQPVRTGFDFDGYFDARTGGVRYYNADKTASVETWDRSESALALFAHWTAHRYRVRFDANGGEGTMDDMEDLPYDERTTLPPCAFSNVDMKFRGWALTADGPVVHRNGGSVSGLTDVNGGVVTLYAVWGTAPDGFDFETCDVFAEKGGAFELVVCGGSDESAASVKLNVAYGNAKAADLVLKNATVSGADGVEMTNLKFPLTLSWAAGDIEPKTIVIPVAAGKATDAPKFLAWNLTDARGLELGETACCIGRIAAGEKWSGEDVYVLPTVADAAGGKVSGGASVKPDKKAVTLKATPNKGYWFAGWYGADGEWASGDLSFKVTPDGGFGPLSKYEARFVPAQPSLSGTYNGYARVNLKGMTLVKGADTSADVYGDYPVTVTLSTAGKVSGSITVGGKKVSFKADGCSGISDSGEGDEWAAFRFPVEEKSWFGQGNVETLQLEISRSSSAGKCAEYGVARLGGVSSAGAYAPLGDEQSGFAYRNVDKSDVKLLAPFVGSYAAALDYGDEGVIPLSVSVDKNGKVKASGKHLDGTSLTMSGALAYRFTDEAWSTGTDPQEDAIVHLFAVPKALGGGALHVTASLTYRKNPGIVDIESWGVVTQYATSGVRAFNESSSVAGRYSSSCWFPADADPDFGVVRLTTGEDVIDILYASKSGKITGLGKATSKDYAVKFDAKTGLLTVTKGKAYTIQGVLGDYASGCYRAGRINADKTCESVDIAFTTLTMPDESFPWTADGFELTLGQAFGEGLQPSVESEDGPLELTVTGLPAGLKYDKKTGRITGAPTKAGAFTVKVGYSYGTRKITRETTLVVNPKPEGLPIGTYAGSAAVYVDGTNEGQRVDCPFTATIDKNGALSGSITLFGKKATFKASGYGYGSEGSSDYTATLDLKAVDKTWGTAALSLWVEGDEMSAEPTEPFGDGAIVNGVVAYRNQTKDAGYADRVAPYVGTYVAALSTAVDADRYGVTTLSATVDKKGTVKLAGTFADGTAFSGSAPLALFEGPDGEWATVNACVAPKSLAQGAMLISLMFYVENGSVVLSCPLPLFAAKYVRTTGEYAESSLVCVWGYRYSSLAWVDSSVKTWDTCLSVTSDGGSFGETHFEWKYTGCCGLEKITGIGKNISGPAMAFKVDEKTGLFSGTCGSYKIFGAMEEGACSGIGTAVGKDGSVDWVWVEVAASPLNP